MVSTPSRLSASRITLRCFHGALRCRLSTALATDCRPSTEPAATPGDRRPRRGGAQESGVPAAQYRAGLGPGDEGYVAAQHARILSSRALPRRSPPFHLFVADLQGQRPPGDVDADHVPVLDQSDGAAVERLGRHVADAGSPAGAAEAAVGDERHAAIETRAGQGRGGREHLRHARTALRSHVPDDHDRARD